MQPLAHRVAAPIRQVIGEAGPAADDGRLRFGLLVALAELTLFNAYQLYAWLRWEPAGRDFAYFYCLAKTALRYGMARAYDPVLQARTVAEVAPQDPFYPLVNPPPLPWLVTPLLAFPLSVAVWIWIGLCLVILAGAALIAAPASRFHRLLFSLSWLGFLPAYLTVSTATVIPLLVGSVVAAWWLLRRDHPVWAGIVLSAVVLKPPFALLVAPALLIAGFWRVFLAWAIASGVLTAASLLALGRDGIAAYLHLSLTVGQDAYFFRWSLVPITGDGGPWLIAVFGVLLAFVIVAYLSRSRAPDSAIVIGLMASFLINHHAGPADFMLLLPAVWLLARDASGPFQRLIPPAAWTAGWLTVLLPVIAVPLEIALVAVAVTARAGQGSRTVGKLDGCR